MNKLSIQRISQEFYDEIQKIGNIEDASLMISSGEDILWVSNMLGHKSANITLQIYAKYIKSETKKRGSFLLD